MKYDWKKFEKQYYFPGQVPQEIELPKQRFITIKGQGNPNSEGFSERIGVLYSVAYAIKMMPRHGFTPEGYFDFAVYPLEGCWGLTEKGIKLKEAGGLVKEELIYTLMMKQPDFVSQEVFQRAIDYVAHKKPHNLLGEVHFETVEAHRAVQILHIGSYDDEPISFEKMTDFMAERDLKPRTLVHKEIYLGDPRKTAPEKRKTVLRYTIE